MEPPGELLERIGSLSAECGVALELTRFWPDEFRPGWYGRFRGLVHRSRVVTIHVAGSLWVDPSGERGDEVDLFLFANGDRLGRLEKPNQYLHRRGEGPFRWDDLDEGFEFPKTLDAIAMTDRE